MIETNTLVQEKIDSNFVWDNFSKNWLKKLLETEIVTIKFTKRDGSIREMKATRRPDLIASVKNTETKVNENILKITDTEIKEWRSIRFDSIMEIKFNLE